MFYTLTLLNIFEILMLIMGIFFLIDETRIPLEEQTKNIIGGAFLLVAYYYYNKERLF